MADTILVQGVLPPACLAAVQVRGRGMPSLRAGHEAPRGAPLSRKPPSNLMAALQADAQALSECPNYWVPRDVVEGRQPALTAAEQVVQHLFRQMAKGQLAAHDASWTGAEYWCQVSGT